MAQQQQVVSAVVDVLESEGGPLLLGELIRRLKANEVGSKSGKQGLVTTLAAQVRLHLGKHVSVAVEFRNGEQITIFSLASARGARIELDLLAAKVSAMQQQPQVVAPTAAALSALAGAAHGAQQHDDQ